MVRKITYVLLIIGLLSSCGGGEDFGGDTAGDENDLSNSSGSVQIDEETISQLMKDVINSINPVEMAALIQETGHPFSKSYLAPTDNVDQYNTNFKKASNLGLYGVDLGYIAMYEKTSTIMPYLNSIKRLADDLKIGQFFDFNTLKELAQDNRNLDSLRFLSVNSFNKMDSYLRDNKRSDVSLLMITGLWIEAMHLAFIVYEQDQNEKIAERIGEQKLIINLLAPIINELKEVPNFDKLNAHLQAIKNIYKDVNIKYIPGEPIIEEKDGMMKVIQVEESIVEITPEQIKALHTELSALRNYIIE